MDLLPRALEQRIRRSWESFPVLVVEGPRAAGKTRLAELIVGPQRLFRLDDAGTLEAAQRSPRAWIEQLPVGSAIDEAQALDRISVEAKRIADAADAQPGRLLLTGSYRLSRTDLAGKDSLAGRAKRFTLWPFSQAELAGKPVDGITALFDDDPRSWTPPSTDTDELRGRLVRGGFPNVRSLPETELADWARDYAPSVIGDLRTGREVDRLVRFFRWLSANGGRQRNLTEFGVANEVNVKTIDVYLRELRHLFLVFDVENLADFDKRQSRTTKLYPADPLFAAAATNMVSRRGAFTPDDGTVLEVFVASELLRLREASSTRTGLFWWRNKKAEEVDFVLEREGDNQLVGIEVKSAREYRTEDFKGLRALRNAFPGRFHRGFVLYGGDTVAPIDDQLWAVPLSILWNAGASQVIARDGNTLSRSPELAAAVERLRSDSSLLETLMRRYGAEALTQIGDAIKALEPTSQIFFSGPAHTRNENGIRMVLVASLPNTGPVEIQIGLGTELGELIWTARWKNSLNQDWRLEVTPHNADEHVRAMQLLLAEFAKDLGVIIHRLRQPQSE